MSDVHEAYGMEHAEGILSVNACNCDLRYRASNAPVVVDWDGEEMRLASEA